VINAEIEPMHGQLVEETTHAIDAAFRKLQRLRTHLADRRDRVRRAATAAREAQRLARELLAMCEDPSDADDAHRKALIEQSVAVNHCHAIEALIVEAEVDLQQLIRESEAVPA
jgi:hypothetical protein